MQQCIVLRQTAAQAPWGEGWQASLETGEVHRRGVGGLVRDAGARGQRCLWQLPPATAWGASTRG